MSDRVFAALTIVALAVGPIVVALIAAIVSLVIFGDYLPVLSYFGIDEDSAAVDMVLIWREAR